MRRTGVFGVTAAVTLAMSLSAFPVAAVEYPTWDDVIAAKSSTEKTAAKANEIKALIAQLERDAQQAQATADQRGDEFDSAENDLLDVTARLNDIIDRANMSKAEAEAASLQAGRLAAQMYRSGGNDLGVNLLIENEDGEELLAKLGNMTKLAERSNGVYVTASVAQNTARALGEAVKLAQQEREKIKEQAASTMAQAMSAAQTAAAALETTQNKTIELQAQLDALQAKETATLDEYRKGVEARKAAADRERGGNGGSGGGNNGGGNNGGGSSGPDGPVGGQGWAVPAYGPITDTYGPRTPYCSGGSCTKPFHTATDIGARCNAPVYAASNGTVTYSGRLGSYGNWILIDHGEGISTGYAHNDVILSNARVGSSVHVGEKIAEVGTTGISFGCHLHFEVRIDGDWVDPEPFMAKRGAPLG